MGGWTTKLGLATAGMLALAQAAGAQNPPPASETTSAVRTFDPGFFTRFNPVTAQDMVRQLPGFSIDNGDSLRGFGATAGNVLVDGKRPSSKTSISDELSRIPARDVARIELIGAAAAGDVDVRGYTEIANVVLKQSNEMQVSSTYSAFIGQVGKRLGGRVGGSRTWKTQDLTVRLNAQTLLSTQRNETDITRFNTADDVISRREEFSQQNLADLQINGSINWAPTARDLINVTGRVMPRLYTRDSTSIGRNPGGVLTDLDFDDYEEKDILHADLGGDWEHRFSPQNSVKLILVNSFVGWKPRELFSEFDAAGLPDGASRINSDNVRGEHVLRGVWTLKPDESHTVEMGLEGAFNYRDTDRTIEFDGGGGFMPVALPVASTRVEEARGEAFITDTWRIDPKLTLELGFTYEASTITQTGDAEQERDFTYPKPRAVATWAPTADDQFRFAVERNVAQLDFSQFASNVQFIENQLTVGNPDLEPAQTWETSLQWKRKIGERGSLSITLTHQDIDGVQDLLPLRLTTTACLANPNDPACIFTAAGNIGDGERWTGFLETTLPLDTVGVKGGLLKFFLGLTDSSVIDPITATDRQIANDIDYRWNIEFRQDLPDLKLAWGGDYTDVGEGAAFRLNEEQFQTFGGGDLDLFIETTYFKGVTLKLAVDNIGDQPYGLERRFFTPNRFPGGTFAGSEFRESTNGPTYVLSAAGSF